MRDHRLRDRDYAEQRTRLAPSGDRESVVGRTTLVEAELGHETQSMRAGYGRSVFAGAAATVYQRAAVQAYGDLDGADVHAIAARGVAGHGGALPYLDAIQKSFGRHDVTGVRAHIGDAGAQAAIAIGARAYATGDAIAFASSPDLHLAAHEAAHVVQQRAGVQLPGGVGRAGDAYERHADAVADLVVQGASAESLLDRVTACGSTPGTALQRDEEHGSPAATQRHDAPRRPTLSTLDANALSREIRFLAGEVGESRQLELEVTVPIPETPLLTGGKLSLEVARSTAGYKVSLTPQLRIGLGTADASADASLFSELTTEVRGQTPEVAAGLLEVALDHTLRSCRRDLPSFVRAVALAAGPVPTLLVMADDLISFCTDAVERPSAVFWTTIADGLFDQDRLARTQRAMRANDYAETRDRIGVSGNLRPAGGRRSSAAVALEDRWRLQGRRDTAPREITDRAIEVSCGVPGFSAKVRLLRPAPDPDVFAGECSITIEPAAAFTGLGTALLTNSVISGVFGEAIRALASDAPEARHTLETARHIGHTVMVSGLQDIARMSGAAQNAKLSVGITIPFDGSPMTATLKLVSSLDLTVGGDGGRFTQSRQIGDTWTGPGVTYRLSDHDQPRDGLGAHQSMNTHLHRAR